MSNGNPTERTLPVALLWAAREAQTAAAMERAEVQTMSDEYLLTSLRHRDRDALAELFRRYSRLVFSIAVRILRDAGESEEIVQEVFLYLFQRTELFDERKGGAKAWLVQIAYHRSLDRREYLQRRKFYSGTNVEFVADTLPGKADVEGDVASRQDRERLKESFTRLSDRQRLTLELFFFEGADFREIAVRLDESVENIRHHYYRGLRRLRQDIYVRRLRGRNEL